MTVAVIADSHLGGPGGDGEDMVAQLEALPDQGIKHLILLGDIFHVWVGSRQFETAEICKILPILRRLRTQGLRVDYIEGNRDFFISGSVYADAFDHVGFETSFASQGRRVLAIHGDGLNDRDRQYLFWRWLSKSPPSRFLIRNLPAALAQRLVHGTEKRLAQTNFKHRSEIPAAAIKGYGERRFKEGYDLMILGHFHEAQRFVVAGGEILALDAWFRSRRVETFAGNPK
jgi:UDP-2,3-diacylglucosamine hydrolase